MSTIAGRLSPAHVTAGVRECPVVPEIIKETSKSPFTNGYLPCSVGGHPSPVGIVRTVISEADVDRVADLASQLPPAESWYLEDDFVINLLVDWKRFSTAR